MNQPDNSTVSLILAAWPIWVPLILIAVGFFTGRHNEKKHLADLERREAGLRHITLVAVKHPPPTFAADRLVCGSVVLTSDSFRNLVALLHNLIGGRIGVYETLLERARREALLRLKEKAAALGADTVCNVKIDTVTISQPTDQSKGGLVGTVEIFAYGTAGTTAGGKRSAEAV